MYGTETGPGAAAQKSFDVLTILDSGKTPRLSNLLFSANPSHRSLSFSSSGLTTWIPQTFTVTFEHARFYFLVFLFYTF